jgi:hypothetical protein
LLRLWGPGYKSFLDQNLSTLTFFFGAFAELGYIAVRGGRAYLKELQRYYDLPHRTRGRPPITIRTTG